MNDDAKKELFFLTLEVRHGEWNFLGLSEPRSDLMVVFLDELLLITQDDEMEDWATVHLSLTLDDLRFLLNIALIAYLDHRQSMLFLATMLSIRLTKPVIMKGNRAILFTLVRQMGNDPRRLAFFRRQLIRLYASKQYRHFMEEPSFHLMPALFSAGHGKAGSTGIYVAEEKSAEALLNPIVRTKEAYLLLACCEDAYWHHWDAFLEAEDVHRESLRELVSSGLGCYLGAHTDVVSPEEAVRTLLRRGHNEQARMEALENENARLRAAYQQDMQEMAALVEDLRMRKAQGEELSSLLAGQKIMVIGDPSHYMAYQTIIESLGGTLLFSASGEKVEAARGMIDAADHIFLITAYAKHNKTFMLKAQGAKKKTTIIPVAGIRSFQEKVEAYLRGESS